MSSASSSLIQSSSSEVDGFLRKPGVSRTLKKVVSASRSSSDLSAGIVHAHDLLHGFRVGKADVVEEAAAQERIRQFFLVVAGDEDDGPVTRLHQLARLVDEELHAIELAQQVVGEFDVGLVDLVDEQHRLHRRLERLPQAALPM